MSNNLKAIFLPFVIASIMGCTHLAQSTSPSQSSIMGQTTPSSSANLAEKSPKQAILDTLQFYQTAMAKGDTDAIMSVFADDAVIEFQGKPTLQGKSAIRQSYEQAFDVMDFTGIDYISTSVEVIGDTAIVRTTHADNATVYHKKLAKKIVDNNREVFVFKNKNGAWQISYYMYNQKAGH